MGTARYIYMEFLMTHITMITFITKVSIRELVQAFDNQLKEYSVAANRGTRNVTFPINITPVE